MWSRIEDTVPHHRKFAKAGSEASWLWVCGLVHANRELTDGFIPEELVPVIGVIKHPHLAAARLVTVGLWEKAPGGYQIHDFHDFNPHSADVKRKREADRVRKESQRSPHGIHAESARNPDDASRARAIPSHPTPVLKKREPASTHNGSPQNGDGVVESFKVFWEGVSKKHDRAAALKEWKSLHPTPAQVAEIATAWAASEASEAWQKAGGRYRPKAANWLRDHRWTEPVAIAAPRVGAMPVYSEWDCHHATRCGNRRACEILTDLQRYRNMAAEEGKPH